MSEDDDSYFRFAGGTVIVRPGGATNPWLLTWLPDAQDDPAYPGFTISPTSVEFPTAHGVGGVLEWAARQSWARRAAGEEMPAPAEAAPTHAEPLDVPVDEYAAFSRKVRLDFGWNVAFSKEPDGSFAWAVIAEDGTQLQSGTADTWDDARLAVIDRLAPPSPESGSAE